jgi:hypothetical protein
MCRPPESRAETQRVLRPPSALSVMAIGDPTLHDGEPVHTLMSTLALADTDEEIAVQKREQNARQSPIIRLPDELLVSILLLSQFGTATFCSMDYVELVPDLKWWQVMSVSSRFHDTIVNSPTLWAAHNSEWSQRWIQLCSQRAQTHTLRSVYTITSQSPAEATRDPLSRSSHAVLNVDVYRNINDDVTSGHQCYPAFLCLNSPFLLSLRIQNARRLPTLTLTPTMLALFPRLSYLNINVTSSVEVDDTFSFPSGLKWLSMTWIIISTNTERLRRLFAGVPSLEYFEILGIDLAGMDDQPFIITDPSSEPAVDRLVLPLLSTLKLRAGRALQLAHGISRVLAVPKHCLEIQVDPNETEDEDMLLQKFPSAGQRVVILDLYDYARQFWHGATGRATLPPATLYDYPPEHVTRRHTYHTVFQSNTAGREYILKLDINTYPDVLQHLDLLTSCVVHLKITAWSRRSVFDLREWDTPCSFPALETMEFACNGAWRAIEHVQEWVDARTQRPVLVQFSARRHKHSVLWYPNDGRLRDADWHAYIAEEAAYIPLPRSEDGL